MTCWQSLRANSPQNFGHMIQLIVKQGYLQVVSQKIKKQSYYYSGFLTKFTPGLRGPELVF